LFHFFGFDIAHLLFFVAKYEKNDFVLILV